MIHYDVVNNDYMQALKSKHRTEKLEIELLDGYERAVMDMTPCLTTDGRTSCSNSMGAQRSASFTFADPLGKVKKLLMVNSKLAVYYGVSVGGDTFFHSMGIFVVKSISRSDGTITAECIDKYGLLNGELKTGAYMADLEIDPESGNVYDVVSAIWGGIVSLDPTEPLVENSLKSEILKSSVTAGCGEYISSVLEMLAKQYGCNCYYNRFGQFVFERIFDYGFPGRIMYRSSAYNFDEIGIADISYSENFDQYNTVIVSTDNTDGDNVTAVVENNNPMSPYNVQTVGTRLYNGEETSGGVYTVPVAQTSAESLKQCKDMGAYLLTKQSAQSVTVTFSAPIVPHITTGDIITAEESFFQVQDIDFSFSDLGTMQITASNIDIIPIEGV